MKVLITVTLLCTALWAQAQKGKTVKARANDHLMVQFGYDNWNGLPDSVKTKGFSRGAGIYGMINFPFKTSKNFSVAIGAGVSSTNIFLDKQAVDLLSGNNTVIYRNLANTRYFSKYKVTAAFVEAPLELRWTANPDNVDKSFKAAIGVKVGTLLTGYTKGKTLMDGSNGSTVSQYTEKIKKKNYFNSSRVALTARVGWGHFSVFGQYQATTLFREGYTAEIRPYSIGITFSGL